MVRLVYIAKGAFISLKKVFLRKEDYFRILSISVAKFYMKLCDRLIYIFVYIDIQNMDGKNFRKSIILVLFRELECIIQFRRLTFFAHHYYFHY